MNGDTSVACGHRLVDNVDNAVGVGTAYGTFGELLQGVLSENDLDFLVTFPISCSSTATFELSTDPDIDIRPAHKHKARRLARCVLDAYGYGCGGVLRLTSDLPEGKGLASSSADLVATARAVAGAVGAPLDEPTVEAFLRDIEPSDGVMYQGIVAFYHREVRLRKGLGFLPPLTIVAHDEGGIVDTLRFNRVAKPFTSREKREYDVLLRALEEAVRAGDLRTVGEISTRSARLNAKLLPRRDFEEMLRICVEVDGLGLVVAHSGTNLGILIAGDGPDAAARIEYARKSCGALPGEVATYRSLSLEDYRS